MIICYCHVVSDRRVCDVVRGGASSVDEVGEACGAGTGCGSCKPMLARLLARELDDECEAAAAAADQPGAAA